MRRLALASLIVAIGGAGGVRVDAAEPLWVRALSRDRSVSAGWLDTIATEAAVALERSSCLPVRPVPMLDPGASSHAEGSLLLEIDVGELEETMTYDQSLAETLRPDAPGRSLNVSASVKAAASWSLRRVGRGPAVAERTVNVGVSYRPVVIGEDAAARARDRAVRKIATEISRWSCKRGTLKRLIGSAPSR